ncbi:phage minor capsid protein [Clostridium algidicarnis]|uniref:phage minor capsid protein n=1 Tax=Clostridium algidicarnis TaxID=37659 RepID=UPI00209B4137|nr:phage minor capsid protein [Clostridium algidicarnis]
MDRNKKPSKLGDILRKITKKTIQEEAYKQKNTSYDIRKIFEDMELNLISSMKRAFYFHQVDQNKEGFEWEQWQLTKLREIEKYRKRNKKLVDSYNGPIQKAIDRELQGNYSKGQSRVEKLIDKVKRFFGGDSKVTSEIVIPLDTEESQAVRGYIDKILNRPTKPPQETNFFGVNDRKLEALQKSVTEDLIKGQHAVLRKMDDVYRQTIYKAQVNMSAGTKTLNQAVDMAAKDFLDKGINCIEYKDGKRVNIASYAEMALRTASHRATLLGEGKKRDEYGLHLVVVSAHANTCKHCEPWQGEVLIDDVFSHPNKEFIDNNKQYALLSEAIEKRLLHPNCRHTLTTYFPGVTQLPLVPDGKEAIKVYEAEQLQRYMERQIRKWKRFEAGSCDIENQEKAHAKVKELEKELREHLDKNKQLRRDYSREEPGQGITNKSLKVNAERLKEKALDDKIEETRNYIKSDELPKEILIGKQGKHILGHNNYIEGRSYLTISLEEAQELVNKYAGSGSIKFNRKGEWDKKEFIKVEKNIGINVNNDTGEQTPTNKLKIHYSKKGTHIVPTLREEK